MKSKFRVYATKYCRGCKKKHEFPTHRYLFMQETGEGEGVRQVAWRKAVALLDRENRSDKDKKRQQRPLWQYDIPVEG